MTWFDLRQTADALSACHQTGSVRLTPVKDISKRRMDDAQSNGGDTMHQGSSAGEPATAIDWVTP